MATPGRRERNKNKIRERIFRAAVELFATQGLQATTVEDITEAADVGKGTFFNYFPSKEYVLSYLFEIQLRKVTEAHEAAEAGKKPIRDVLSELMWKIVQEPGRTKPLAQGLLAALFSSETMRGMMVDTLREGRGHLCRILELGQARGEVRRDREPAAMARHFQQSSIGTVFLWSLGPTDDLSDRIGLTFDLYWSGVSASEPAPVAPGRGR